MSFPHRITKDTSARKGPAALTPHDAALQAYMQSFINSIHDNTAAATHARHSEHLHDSQALKVCFIESYNDAVGKLNKKFADDLTALNAERDAKVAELRREFANDPLSTIVKQQHVATGRNEQGSMTMQRQSSQTRVSVAAEAEVLRTAAIKQEPVEEGTQAAPMPTGIQGVSTARSTTEPAKSSRSPRLSESLREVENTVFTSEVQQQDGGCTEVAIAGSAGKEAEKGNQGLVEVKSEVVQAGLEHRDVRADSVVAASNDQIQKTSPLDACPGTDNSTDRSVSSVYVDLTAA